MSNPMLSSSTRKIDSPIEYTGKTINICPHWIDIIDIMLEAWKEGNLSREQREDMRKEFHKLALCGDEIMKQNEVGPYSVD